MWPRIVLNSKLSYIYLPPLTSARMCHTKFRIILLFLHIFLYFGCGYEWVGACMPSCMYWDQKAIIRNQLFPPTTRVSGIKLKSPGLLTHAFTSEPPYSNICKCDSYRDISRKVLVLPKVEISKVKLKLWWSEGLWLENQSCSFPSSPSTFCLCPILLSQFPSI